MKRKRLELLAGLVMAGAILFVLGSYAVSELVPPAALPLPEAIAAYDAKVEILRVAANNGEISSGDFFAGLHDALVELMPSLPAEAQEPCATAAEAIGRLAVNADDEALYAEARADYALCVTAIPES